MTKSPASASTVVRLSGPQGLVAAVPQYLGFIPEDSLVMLCLSGPRGLIGPVARIDLFPPVDQALVQLLDCARHYADEVAVVCYHDGPRPAALDSLLSRLVGAKIPLTAVLSVRDGRIYDSADPATEHNDPGVPLPGPADEQVQKLAAASAFSGRSVLPSRAALRESIAAPAGERLAGIRAAIVACCAGLAADLDGLTAADVRRSLRARADAVWADALAQHRDSGSVGQATAAALIVLCAEISVRDRVIAAAVGAGDPDAVPVLISVASWCPDEEAAEICGVLAVVAYRYGDGALAQCAVDRTLAAEPRHRLAHLMLSVMAAGLPPEELVVMAAAGADTDPAQNCSADEIPAEAKATDVKAPPVNRAAAGRPRRR